MPVPPDGHIPQFEQLPTEPPLKDISDAALDDALTVPGPDNKELQPEIPNVAPDIDDQLGEPPAGQPVDMQPEEPVAGPVEPGGSRRDKPLATKDTEALPSDAGSSQPPKPPQAEPLPVLVPTWRLLADSVVGPDTQPEESAPDTPTTSPEDDSEGESEAPENEVEAEQQPERTLTKADVLTPYDHEEMYRLYGEAFANSRVEPGPRYEARSNPTLGSDTMRDVTLVEEGGEEPLNEPAVREDLEHDRRVLADLLHGCKASQLDNGLLQVPNWPPELRDAVAACGNPNESITMRLTMRDPQTGQPLVSDEILLKVMRWHNARVAADEAALQDSLPHHFAHLGSSVLRGVNEGWLPPQMLKEAHKVKEHTAVRLDDGCNLIPRGADGDYLEYPDVIRLHDPNSRELFLHEAGHAMFQGDAGTKLMPAVGSASVAHALGEATVTLWAESAIRPGQRLDPSTSMSSVYKENIWLLDSLCRFGDRPIDARRFIDSFVEMKNIHTNKIGPATEALGEAIRHNFSREIVQALSQARELYPFVATWLAEIVRGNSKNPALRPQEADFTFIGRVPGGRTLV